ncbi:MAG: EamA family transporter [Lachnospiraceae bacterium]|nr:EamA family transporter [Lachnospiraceae bacterium]
MELDIGDLQIYNRREIQSRMKKKITIRDIIYLQIVVVIYTLSSIVAKFASGQTFLSWKFLLFYGMEVACLGVYAILWQQAIKKVELSIAYANKAMGVLWSMIWAVLIFHNQITLQNIIGVSLVIIGTIVLNNSEESEVEA